MASAPTRSSRRLAALVGLSLGALALGAWSRAWLDAAEETQQEGLREVLLVPPGEVIRDLDLGYHSLAADLLFVRANLYYGQHMLSDEQLPWLSTFVETLLTVDPDFKKAYEWSSLATLYYKRQIDYVPAELIERANRILERGMLRFPDDHVFPMRIGFNLYYEAGDSARALPYFAQAAAKPGAPGWLPTKMLDLLPKAGDLEMARQLVASMVVDAGQELSQALRDRLAHLVPPAERAQMLRLREQLRARWQAEWAYLPFDLYLLVGDP